MSAPKSRKKFTCKTHEEKQVKFVCKNCRYQLLCSICERTEHRGHTVLDIKTAGVETRKLFTKEIAATDDCISKTQLALSKKRSFQTNRDKTTEEIILQMQTNAEELKRKLDEYFETQMKYAEQLATEHSNKTQDIEALERTLECLQEKRLPMTKLLDKLVPDEVVIGQFQMLATSGKCRKDAQDKVSKMSGRNVLMFLLEPSVGGELGSSAQSLQGPPPNKASQDDWEHFAKKMIGFPKMTYTAVQNLTSEADERSYSRDMAVVQVLSLSLGGDDVPILALHIADEDRIFVAYPVQSPGLPQPSSKAPAKTGEITVSVLNNNGEKIIEECLYYGVAQPAITTVSWDKTVRLFCTQSYSKHQLFHLGTLFPLDKVHESVVCCVKRGSLPLSGKSYKIYKISTTDEPDEMLFTVQLEDVPQRVVTNNNADTFAVILDRNSGSKKQKKNAESVPAPQLYVAVYTKKNKDPSSAPELKGTFGKEGLEEVAVDYMNTCKDTAKLSELEMLQFPEDLQVSDVCFYQKSSLAPTAPLFPSEVEASLSRFIESYDEVLIVATARALIVVDFENKCSVLDIFILGCSGPGGSPLLPTALTTDRDGQLWIGCRGGKVLCWVPLKHVMKSGYLEPAAYSDAHASAKIYAKIAQCGDGNDSDGSGWATDEFEDDEDQTEDTNSSPPESRPVQAAAPTRSQESHSFPAAAPTHSESESSFSGSDGSMQEVQAMFMNSEDGASNVSSQPTREHWMLQQRQGQMRGRRNTTPSQVADLRESGQSLETPRPRPARPAPQAPVRCLSVANSDQTNSDYFTAAPRSLGETKMSGLTASSTSISSQRQRQPPSRQPTSPQGKPLSIVEELKQELERRQQSQ